MLAQAEPLAGPRLRVAHGWRASMITIAALLAGGSGQSDSEAVAHFRESMSRG
jgi:hypothetical protein